MNLVHIYCVIVGGSLITVLSVQLVHRSRSAFRFAWTTCVNAVGTHLIYPYVVRRHWFGGPTTRSRVVLYLCALTLNIFCVTFQVASLAEASSRAGSLALANSVLLLISPHLALVADQLGLTITTLQAYHQFWGVLVFLLAATHVAITVTLHPISFDQASGIVSIVAGGLLCSLLLPMWRRLRWPYELFLRSHQLFALGFASLTFYHLPSEEVFPRLYTYVAAGLFLSFSFIQAFRILRQTRFFSDCPSATLSPLSNQDGILHLSIRLRAPIRVSTGQYINCCFLGLGLRAMLQSHPFMVISWAPDKQDTIDCVIWPQRGLSSKLNFINCPVAFSGPHGRSINMDCYELVLMVASGFGLVTHMSYIQKLIHDHKSHISRLRLIHLVYQISLKDSIRGLETLMNSLIELDTARIFYVSIYSDASPSQFAGSAEQFSWTEGKAPLESIIREKHQAYKSVLVTVSTSDDIRDELHGILAQREFRGVRMSELDYQCS